MREEVSTNREYEQGMRNIIERASRSVIFFAVAPAPVAGLRALLRQAQTDVAVELIVPTTYLEKVGLTDRYLANLTAAGGRFFLVDLPPAAWRRIKISPRSLLLVDDETVWKPTGEAKTWRVATGQQARVGQQFGLLRQTGTMPVGKSIKTTAAKARSKETTLPVISFGADTTLVRAGGEVRLHWSVPGATTVEVQPRPGRVRNFGVHSLRITAPTEFTLTAHHAEGSIAKVLKVEVDRRADLDYYLMIADPLGIGSPTRLRDRPDLPGFFGALYGAPLTLHWRTTNAATVVLNGGPVDPSGEHTFLPEGKATLRLRVVGVLGEVREEEIVIHTFRAPARVPDELLAVAEPELPQVGDPALPVRPSPLPQPDADQDPLLDLEEEVRRDLRRKWREKSGGGMRNLRTWFKNLGG